MDILPEIKSKSDQYKAWRRKMHAMPELAFEERLTSDFIAAQMEKFGIQIDRGMAETAVVGTLHGKGGPNGKAIALRADMDALPMDEHNEFDHKSCHDGKMHGCGHDGHSAMLLGAAEYLAEHTDTFDGTIYFVFQPAEEGQAGAKRMVEEGFFDKYPCQAIYGMHNWPGLPVGKMAIRPGPMTANSDRFDIVLTGKGGHAAFPHLNKDVIVAGSALVSALQTIVSRKVSANDSAVVTTSIFQAGSGAHNVMPNDAKIGGSVRTFGEDARDAMKLAITDIATHTAAAHGVTADVKYHYGYPSVVNSPDETDMAIKAARDIVGKDNVDDNYPPVMGAEDFAFFLQHSKGAYIALGQSSESNKAPLHSPNYDFNDDITPIGASYWIKLAQNSLPPA